MNTTLPASIDVTGTTEYDPDMEPKPDEQHMLKWREDPDITHSDWKIEIVGTSDHQCDGKPIVVATYHVHKYVLGCGNHRSSYFESIFRRSYAEGESQTSRIELHPIAAQAFPQLLDFVYSSDDSSIRINTENSTALHYLGQYFQIDRLRWLARQFWKKDMSLNNVDFYYQHATIFCDDDVLKAATSICARNIMKITPSSSIVDVSDSKLWLAVLEEVSEDENILHLSSLIAQHCETGEVDVETFKELTAEEKLPHVSSNAARKLSDLEDKLVAGDGVDPNVDPTKKQDEVSSLQQRCVESMTKDWKKLGSSGQDMMEFLKRKRPMFLVELLARSTAQAKEENDTLQGQVIYYQFRAEQLEQEKSRLEEANTRLTDKYARLKKNKRSNNAYNPYMNFVTWEQITFGNRSQSGAGISNAGRHF